MRALELPSQSEVIRQGDIGDRFYCIESGSVDIIVNGNKVAVFGSGTTNMSFGELALLYNAPRAATVVTSTPCKFWTLDRKSFRCIIAKASMAQQARLMASLRRGIFTCLSGV
jgi:cAMP-dependent protein kinase regulator